MKKPILIWAILYALILIEMTKLVPKVTWHIPFAGIDLPVAFWLVFLFYSFLYIIFNRNSIRNILYPVSVGIILDIMGKFIFIEASRSITNCGFEAKIYSIYYYFMYSAVMLFLCFMAAYILRMNTKRDAAGPHTIYFAIPFLAVFIISVGQLGERIPALAAFFCLVILLSAVLLPVEKIAEKVKNSVTFVVGWLMSHEKLALTLLFAAAVLIRLIYLVRTMSAPNYVATGADGVLFDAEAWKIATGQNVVQAYEAGYWFFLAFIYKIFGHNYFIACFIQIVINALACLFIYTITKKITQHKLVAFVAFLLASVNFSIIFSAVSLGHQALDCFLLPLAALLLIYFLDNKNAHGLNDVPLLIASGLVMGYSTAAREPNLLLAAAVLIFLCIDGARRRKLVAGIAYSLVFVVMVALPLVPFAVRNMKNLGVAYPSSYSQTSYISAEHAWCGGSGNEKLIALGINPFKDPIGSLRAMIAHPKESFSAFSESIGHKFQALYMDQDYGRFDMLFLIRGLPFYNSAWLYAFLITVFGLLFMAFYRYFPSRTAVYLVLTFIVLKTIPHLFISSRFGLRAPIDIFLIIAFSVGANRIFFGTNESREKIL